MTNVLSCSAITKSLGGKTVLHDLDLAVARSEVVSLLGPSGSGKTTLLRLIAGLMDPDAGQITLHDRVIWSPQTAIPAEKRRIGMVFQDYALWPHMTVEGNLAFGLKPQRLPAQDMRARIEHALHATKLDGFRDRRPQELSGGQQQRVAIARAMAQRPAMMLFDEPLSNLDAALREDMRTEMMGLVRREGITTVYVTHDQSEAMALSDRIAVMRGGRIAQFDTPQRLYDAPANPFVAGFIGGFTLLPGEGINGRFVPEGGEAPIVTEAVSPKGPALLVVRPEDARPASAHPGTVISGRVVACAYQGRCWRIILNAHGAQLRIDWPDAVDPGTILTVSVPPERCVLLAAETVSFGKDQDGTHIHTLDADGGVPRLAGRGRRGLHHRARRCTNA